MIAHRFHSYRLDSRELRTIQRPRNLHLAKKKKLDGRRLSVRHFAGFPEKKRKKFRVGRHFTFSFVVPRRGYGPRSGSGVFHSRYRLEAHRQFEDPIPTLHRTEFPPSPPRSTFGLMKKRVRNALRPASVGGHGDIKSKHRKNRQGPAREDCHWQSLSRGGEGPRETLCVTCYVLHSYHTHPPPIIEWERVEGFYDP